MLSLALHAKLKLQLSVGKMEVERVQILSRYLQYKLIGFEYGAPVGVSRPSNYRDRLLMQQHAAAAAALLNAPTM